LERNDDVGWDEYDAFIIVAARELKARQLANSRSGNEGHIWTDISRVDAKVIGLADRNEERIILGSYNAG
jgi:hypothetical protein